MTALEKAGKGGLRFGLEGPVERLRQQWNGRLEEGRPPARDPRRSVWTAQRVRSEGLRDEYLVRRGGRPVGSLCLGLPSGVVLDGLLEVLEAESQVDWEESGKRLLRELSLVAPAFPLKPWAYWGRGGIWTFDPDTRDRRREHHTRAIGELSERCGPVSHPSGTELSGRQTPWRQAGSLVVSEAGFPPPLQAALRSAWARKGSLARYALLNGICGPASRLRRDEPMARRTSIRVGGAADIWVEPGDENDLRALLGALEDWETAWHLVGAGTNLIVSDQGVRGVVIRLSGPGFQRLYAGPEGVRAASGVYLRHIVRAAAANGRAGLEFFEGIPGTVGGALRMNAGAMGGEFFDVVERVRCMDRSGRIFEREGSGIDRSYRDCPFFEEHIGLGVSLRTRPESPDRIEEQVRRFSVRRRETQPSAPSAGCIFRNPGPDQPAGKLVDELGLKGSRQGGAVVSPVHGNFILNDRRASARDIVTLIERLRLTVEERTGVTLQPEVRFLGEDNGFPGSGDGGGRSPVEP